MGYSYLDLYLTDALGTMSNCPHHTESAYPMAKGYLIGEGITLRLQYDVGISLLAVTRRLVQRTYE
jgi:hypothetical protein